MKNTKQRRGAGRVAFLARLEEYRALVAAGWPLTAIYDEQNVAGTGLSYSQFARYVARYIRPAPKRKRRIADGNAPAVPEIENNGQQTSGSPGPAAAQRSAASGQRRPGFQHAPNSGNDRDDLI